MTVEPRLREWFASTASEPPRPVTVEQIALRAARGRRRRWQPLLASAVVVLLSLGIVALVGIGHGRHGSAGSVTPSTQASSQRSTTPPTRSTTHATARSSATAPPITQDIWGAKRVLAEPIRACLVTDGAALLSYDVMGRLVRIDPARSRITARVEPGGQSGTASCPVVGPSGVWVVVPTAAASVFELRSFDPVTLAPRRSIRLTFAQSATSGNVYGADIALAHGFVYVSDGAEVRGVDTATGSITRDYRPGDGTVHSIAALGTRLYVATDSRVRTVDAAADAVVADDLPAESVVDGIGRGLVATSAGLWISRKSGNGSSETFVPNGSTEEQVDATFGSAPIVTVSGDIAWTASGIGVSCEDGGTGAVRAQLAVDVNRNPSFAHQFAVVDGRVFATLDYLLPRGRGSSAFLATVTAPSACSR